MAELPHHKHSFLTLQLVLMSGPINSWDRQPYMTVLKDGKTPSFEPLPRVISGNYIIANYGADQVCFVIPHDIAEPMTVF